MRHLQPRRRHPAGQGHAGPTRQEKVDAYRKAILEAVSNGCTRPKEISESTKISKGSISKYLSELLHKKLIKREGNGRAVRYRRA